MNKKSIDSKNKQSLINRNSNLNKSTYNRLRANTTISKIQVFPLILMITIVPLIVRLKINLLSVDVAKYWSGPIQLDFYSYNKAMAIILISVLIIIAMLLTVKKENLQMDNRMKLVFASLAIFTIFTVMSTLLSDNRQIAIWGAPERFEGMIIQLCYVLMLVYTLIIVKDEFILKYIKYAFIFIATSFSIIGISQILGRDILDTDFVYNLMVPLEYKDMVGEIIKSSSIYLTLQNPNYVGSYAALVIPFLMVVSFDNKEKKILRISTMLLAVMTLIILLFSRVQSGIVALAAVIVLAAIILRNKLLLRKKQLGVFLMFTVVLMTSMNIYTGGILFNNIASTAGEAIQFVRTSDTVYDPTYGFQIPRIEFDKKTIKMTTIVGDIDILVDNEYNLTFYDENNKEMDYVKKNNRYTLSKPYNDIFVNYYPDTELTIGFDNSGNPINQKFNPIIRIFFEERQKYIVHLDEVNGYHLIDARYNMITPIIAPHFGFEGKEELGSDRGYIWSRTLPMIKNAVVFGNGPDMFLAKFPHNDLFAKSYVYYNQNTITDKPHNMYLQIAVNNGFLALISLTFLWLMYAYEIFKYNSFKNKYDSLNCYGIACFLGFAGYMVAGFFNDSFVGTAPLYWIMLGCGLAINKICKDREISDEKQDI